MSNENVGFDLPKPAPRRNNRHDKIEREEGVDVGNAVSYLEEAERGALALTDSVRVFAKAAQALLSSGLTPNAVVLLVQDLMPKQSGGSAHGKPKYSKETIAEVLKAAARVSEHLNNPKERK